MSQEISKPDSTPKPYSETETSPQQMSKVAEGVATYAYTPLKKAASVPHQIAGVAVPEEAWRFIVTNELIPHLETAVRVVRESFHKHGKMRFTYQIDPEIENEACVIIHAEVSGVFEELVHEDWAYTKAIVRTLPADKLPLIHLFPMVV
jgi:hypothetical protein